MRAGPATAVLVGLLVAATLVGASADDGKARVAGEVLRLEGVEVHAGRFPMDGENARRLLLPGFLYQPFAPGVDDRAGYWVEGGKYHRAWLGDDELAGGTFAFYGVEVMPTEEHRAKGASHLWILGLIASDERVVAALHGLGLPDVTLGDYVMTTTGAQGAAVVEGSTGSGPTPFTLTTARGDGEFSPSPAIERWFLMDDGRVAGYLDREITMTWNPGGVGTIDASGAEIKRPEPAGQGGDLAGADYRFYAAPAEDAQLRVEKVITGEVSFACVYSPVDQDVVCLPVVSNGYQPWFNVPGVVQEIRVEISFGATSVLQDLEVCLLSPFGDAMCERVSQEPSGALYAGVSHTFVVQDLDLLGQSGTWTLEFGADSPQQATYTARVQVLPLSDAQPPAAPTGLWGLPEGSLWWPLLVAPASLVAAIGAAIRVMRRNRPVEFFLWMGLFTRLKRDEVLDNERRAALLACISNNPGASFSDLRRALDVGSGALAHHLKILQQQEFIKSIRDGIRTRFYIRGQAVRPDTYLTFTQRSVLDAVHSNPGIAQKDLAQLVGLPRQNVAYHVRRLLEMGQIDRKPDGPRRCYYPT